MNRSDVWSPQVGLSGSEPGEPLPVISLRHWLAYWGAAALCAGFGAACAPGFAWQGAYVMGMFSLFVGAFLLVQLTLGRGCLALAMVVGVTPLLYTVITTALMPAYIDSTEANAVMVLGILSGVLAASGRSTVWALLVNLLGYWSVSALVVLSSSRQVGDFAVLAATGLVIPLTIVVTGRFGFGRRHGQARLQRAQQSLAWSLGVFLWISVAIGGLCGPDLGSRLGGLLVGLAGAAAFWARERGRNQG